MFNKINLRVRVMVFNATFNAISWINLKLETIINGYMDYKSLSNIYTKVFSGKPWYK